MANFETTFGSLETDERFKKLERSLKLAQLKKEHNEKMHFDKMTSWPSISSINVNRLNSNCMTSSQISTVGSEILACSDNTRNILSRKKIHNNKQKMISTSSVKQDNYTDRLIMPTENTVYCTFKKPQKKILSPDCEKTESTILNNPMSSIRNTFSLKSSICESANINIDKEYSHSFVTPIPLSNDPQKVDRIFSRWRVMLNDQHELIIKGTLECGKVARSKSVIRRYTATCVESKFKHKYGLQGNIVDERNELPDYIRGKFYNGFPDDWENVYQIWRSYISQGCPMTFHWPTTITDSDDDLKSELTDLTYQADNKTISIMRPYKNEYVRSKSLSIEKSPEKKETCHNFENLNERDCSFIKPSISDKDTTIVQTKSTRLDSEEDRKDIKINPMCHPRKVNKLKDILQEDKLKIIIDNLVDRNCSPEYIHKIIEMLDCLDYVISYKIGSEHKYDSRVSANYEMFKTSETIPLQQTVIHNNNHINTKNFENGTTEKNYIQCTNLEYENIRNDSNPTQLPNSKNSIQLNYNKDLDKSESETYAGIPKVSIKRIFKTREALGKTYKRKMRKKIIHTGTQNYITNPQYNMKESKFKSVYTTIPITNSEQNLLSNESCINVTKNEMETMNMRKCQKFITQEPQEITFSTHQRNNPNIYEENKSTFVQKKHIFNPLETQKINFIKEQKVPRKIYENVDSRFIADVDITSSDIDVISINTNKQKSEMQNTNMIKMQTKSDQNVINSESDLAKKSYIPRKLHTEFIEQLKSELPMKRAKPVIISSMPINLNLKINSIESKSRQMHNSDISIIENEENQCMNIPSMEEACKKSMKTSIVTKPAIITNDDKSTVDSTKQDHPKTNNKNELDNINSANSLKSMTNSTIRQSRNSKSRDKNNPKILTTWMPKVIYYAESKSQTGLIFQGKLLNEAGHVVNRKFSTDIVLRRLSATLIETVNHEFYQLLGSLNDNKHILPKELVRKCRNGCPAKIEQFCQIWKTLQHDNVNIVKEKSHDTSMDSLSVPVSSRGRRILPPLCYWAGERITLKDNNPMYSSGNSQKSLLTSLTENLEKNGEEKKKQKANLKMNISKKQKMFPELNETSNINKNQVITLEKTQSSKNLKITAVNNTKMENKNKSRKSMINDKQAHQLRFSSIDSGQAASRKYECKTDTNADTSSPYTMTLRKRQKTETSSSNRISYDDTIESKHDAICCSSTKKSNYKTTYMYHKNISLADDLLSEIPSSPK